MAEPDKNKKPSEKVAQEVAHDVNVQFFNFCIHEFVDKTPYEGGFIIKTNPSNNVWLEDGQYHVYNKNLETGDTYHLIVGEDGKKPLFEVKDSSGYPKFRHIFTHDLPYKDLQNVFTAYQENVPELKHISIPKYNRDNLSFDFIISSGEKQKNLSYAWDKKGNYDVITSTPAKPLSIKFERTITSEDLEAYAHPQIAEPDHEEEEAYSLEDENEKDSAFLKEQENFRHILLQASVEAEKYFGNGQVSVNDMNFVSADKEARFTFTGTLSTGQKQQLTITRSPDGSLKQKAVVISNPPAAKPQTQAPAAPTKPELSFEQQKAIAERDVNNHLESYIGSLKGTKIVSSNFASLNRPAVFTVSWLDESKQEFIYLFERSPDGSIKLVGGKAPDEREIINTQPPARAPKPQAQVTVPEHLKTALQHVYTDVQKNLPSYDIIFTGKEYGGSNEPVHIYANIRSPDGVEYSRHFIRYPDGRLVIDKPIPAPALSQPPQAAPAPVQPPPPKPSEEPEYKFGPSLSEAMEISAAELNRQYGPNAKITFKYNDSRVTPGSRKFGYDVVLPDQSFSTEILILPNGSATARIDEKTRRFNNAPAYSQSPAPMSVPQAPPEAPEQPQRVNREQAAAIAGNAVRSKFGPDAQINFGNRDLNSAPGTYAFSYDVVAADGKSFISNVIVTTDGQPSIKTLAAKGQINKPQQAPSPVPEVVYGTPPEVEPISEESAYNLAENSIRNYFGNDIELHYQEHGINQQSGAREITYQIKAGNKAFSSTATVMPDGSTLLSNREIPYQQYAEPPTSPAPETQADVEIAKQSAEEALSRYFSKLKGTQLLEIKPGRSPGVSQMSFEVRLPNKSVLSTVEVSDSGKIKGIKHKELPKNYNSVITGTPTVNERPLPTEETPTEIAETPELEEKPAEPPQPRGPYTGPRTPIGSTANQCFAPLSPTYENPNLLQYLTIWIEIRGNEVKQLAKAPEDAEFNEYKCQAGKWTIGFGSTDYARPKGTKTGDYVIDGNKASTMMNLELAEKKQNFEKSFGKNVGDILSPNEYASILSLSYNIGSISPKSSLAVHVRDYMDAKVEGDPERIAETAEKVCNKMKEYNLVRCGKNDKGSMKKVVDGQTRYYKVSNGLVNRRDAECDLFMGNYEEFIDYFSRWKGRSRTEIRNKMGEEIPGLTPYAGSETTQDKAKTSMVNPTTPAQEQYLKQAKELLEKFTTELIEKPALPDVWKLAQVIQQLQRDQSQNIG